MRSSGAGGDREDVTSMAKKEAGKAKKTAGRYRIYKTADELGEAVEGYFDSISRLEDVTVMVGTGRNDKYGHEIMVPAPVKNDSGKVIQERIFYVPPTRGDLCEYLGISRDTWARYCDADANPQFAEVTEWAEDRLRSWRDKELLKRSSKMTTGLIHDLDLNYKASVKQKIEISAPDEDMPDLSDSMLRNIAGRGHADGDQC